MMFGYITASHGLFHFWTHSSLNLYFHQSVIHLVFLPLPGISGLYIVFKIRYTSFIRRTTLSKYTHLMKHNVHTQQANNLTWDIPTSLVIHIYLVKLKAEKCDICYINVLKQNQDETCQEAFKDDIIEVNITRIRHMIHSPRMEGIVHLAVHSISWSIYDSCKCNNRIL